MSKTGLTADQFDTWLPTRSAFALVDRHFGNQTGSMNNILERLKGGLVRAAAKNSAWETDEIPSHKSDITTIPQDHWILWRPTNVSGDLWGIGDIRIFLGDRRVPVGNGQFKVGSTIVRYYGIRFEPSGIYEMVPEQKPDNPSAESHAPIESSGDPKPKGPPVSQAALDAWCVAYKLAYQGPEDTLAKAYASAEGMFPEKFVARQRIRDLLKGRKAGRKAT